MTVVVDASALVELLLRTPRARAVEQAIGQSNLVAPELLDIEVVSAMRRLVHLGHVEASRAELALDDLIAAPILRMSPLPLVPKMWQLRHQLSAYDACYLSLALDLDCPLITRDARLARATNHPVVSV